MSVPAYAWLCGGAVGDRPQLFSFPSPLWGEDCIRTRTLICILNSLSVLFAVFASDNIDNGCSGCGRCTKCVSYR